MRMCLEESLSLPEQAVFRSRLSFLSFDPTLHLVFRTETFASPFHYHRH